MEKINQIDKTISPERLDNLFSIITDKDGKKYFNLTDTLTIADDIPAEILGRYEVKTSFSWHNIAYDIYGSTDLWWIILAVNKDVHPLKLPQRGDVIYFLNKETVLRIIEKMQDA